MRKLFVYFFGIIFLFTSCEDKEKRGETNSNIKIDGNQDPSLNNMITDSLDDKNQSDSHQITNENVVAFFIKYGEKNPETKVLITSRFGDIEIELFEDTPLHRANFIYLVKNKYFDDTFVHRVVPNFIIQAGNSDLIATQKKRAQLGKEYLLPAEIIPGRIHEYGTISGAKEYRENPDNKSAPYEFFIFLGPKSSTTHLNGNYTIFGKVIRGMDVVEKISKVEADEGDWPLVNIYISAKILE